MATLELSTDQIVRLVAQLPPAARWQVLTQIAAEASSDAAARSAKAELALRARATARGSDWDAMSEAERESLAAELVRDVRAGR
jgi:hypothetical protein